jgi:gluconate 2-dehydrogenase gamma chain
MKTTDPRGSETMKSEKHSDEEPLNAGRRTWFKVAGLAAVGVAAGAGTTVTRADTSDNNNAADQARKPADAPAYLFLQPDEAAFIRAASARLIPGDARSPGAREADVTNFIDKALASPWGSGADMYASGPWQPGTPQQGYQLKFTPAELYRTALAVIKQTLSDAGTPFGKMHEAEQDAYLTKLESGTEDLDGVPSAVFFSMLLQNTLEGYLADPIYGGNKDMVGWKAIGFAGAYASWYDLADKHGIDVTERTSNPISIADAPSHVGHMGHSGKEG